MSKLSRLIGMTSKALGDKNGPSQPTGSGSTDWRQMVRSAADAITGDGRDGARTDALPHPASPRSGTASAPPRAHGAVGLTPPSAGAPRPSSSGTASMSEADRSAIARYDYLVQTADPARLEQIHREAFERLTPDQRAQVEARLNESLAPHERPNGRDAGSLARAATRSEMMRPGSLRGLLGRAGGRGGASALAVGGVAAAGGLLAAVAGGAIVSSLAGPLLAQAGELGVDFDALAGGIDPEAIAGGFGDVAGGLGDTVGGVGEQVSGLGDQLSNFEIPGLGDFFGR